MDEFDAVPWRGSSLSSDTDGFDAFYRGCRTEIARSLILAIGDRDLAAEATDEAFARALERWPDVKDYEKPEGWVFRVGLNWARSRLRRRSTRLGVLLDDGHHFDELPEPELLEAVQQLPFQYRSVVVARFFLDWSIQQTADALDLPWLPASFMKRLLPLRMKDRFQNNLDAFGEAIERAYEKRIDAAEAGS